jgi:hypothetical protein
VRRREFVASLASATVLPGIARAQQSRPTIGFLHPGSPSAVPQAFLAEFHQGLADHGWVAGANVNVEYRWAEGQYERLPALAADLVQRQVAAIAVPNGTAAALPSPAMNSRRLTGSPRRRWPTEPLGRRDRALGRF